MIALFHYLLGHTRWHVNMLNGEAVMRRWTNDGWCYRGMTMREQAAHKERLEEQAEMQVW